MRAAEVEGSAMGSAEDVGGRGVGDFLRVESVTRRFGDFRAVDAVSFEVRRGEIFALLGPSGCGKSTLLRMLAGFESPSSGRIVLNGVDLAGQPSYERPVNMMFQSYALFPHLSCWDNVAFGLRREGMPKAEIVARVEEMLRLVQLTSLAKRKPHQLSGGQQQRVALARCLAKRPQLMLLDEPLGALDKKLREATQIELVNIIGEVGVTCVMVTHDQEEAMTMAARIAVMSEGRFLQIGEPAEVYENPASRVVADFIGNVNLMEGEVIAREMGHAHVRCADFAVRIERNEVGGFDCAGGQAVSIALRPEKIHLAIDKPDGDANQVEGVVKSFSYFGGHTLYHLTLESGAELSASVENETRSREGAPRQGDRVWAWWRASSPVVLAA